MRGIIGDIAARSAVYCLVYLVMSRIIAGPEISWACLIGGMIGYNIGYFLFIK